MKKVFLLLLPCLFCFAFMFGCGQDNNTTKNEEILCFNTTKQVELCVNGENNTAVAKLQVNGDILPKLDWDSSVIDYNLQTGVITALNKGETDLTASYKNDNGECFSSSVKVSVVETVYAEEIVLEELYVYKLLDKHIEAKILPKVKSDGNITNEYQLGFTFKSLDENIFTVNEYGDIYPLSLGSAELLVKAVSGYNEYTKEYSYIEARCEILVEEVIKSFKATIVDSEMEELIPIAMADTYNSFNLYHGKKYGQDELNYYYIKLSSDKKIQDCIIQRNVEYNNMVNVGQELITTNMQDVLVGNESYNNGKTICLPFMVRDAGVEVVEYKLIDSVMNYFEAFTAKILLINVYEYIQDATPNMVTYNGDVKLENLVKLNADENGEYTLYLLGGEDEDKLKAREDGFYNQGYLSFNNVSDLSLNYVNVYKDNILFAKNFDISSQALVVEPTYNGKLEIKFVSQDGSGWESVLKFNFEYLNPVTYQFVDNSETINLVYGLSGFDEIDLDVTNITPNYAYKNVAVYSSASNSPITISGTKIKAVKFGECYVAVTLNGTISKSYKVLVCSAPSSIEITTACNANMEIGDVFVLEYMVFDEAGEILNLNEIDIIFKDENNNIIQENEITNFEIKKGLNNIAIIAKCYGNIKMVLISKYNNITSKTINISCN